MRPKICKDNGIKIPTSDCSTCDILEQKVDALTEELETKQDLLTAGNHIEISEDAVISANLDDYYDKNEVNTMIHGVATIQFQVVEELPEEGAGNVIYLVQNGNDYDQYVWTDDGWVAIGSTAVDLTEYVKFTNASSATPLMNGTATAGTSTDYSRADHVHPSDTTKASLASPTFTGTPTVSGTAPASSTSTTQIATTAFTQSAINRRVPKTIASKSGTLSAATGTNTTPDSTWGATFMNANPSTFIGFATADFDTNATGQRRLDVLLNGSTGIGCWAKVSAASGGHTCITVPIVIRLAANQYLRPEVWQNSGSALSCNLYMKGIFIFD